MDNFSTQGRELEWLFADAEGQVSLANQCGAKRVILISFNRSHQYGNMEAVKAEVSAVILPLAPEHARAEPGKIPITTTEQGVGSRHVVARAESPLSGWDAAMPTCMLPAVAELLVASTRFVHLVTAVEIAANMGPDNLHHGNCSPN